MERSILVSNSKPVDCKPSLGDMNVTVKMMTS